MDEEQERFVRDEVLALLRLMIKTGIDPLKGLSVAQAEILAICIEVEGHQAVIEGLERCVDRVRADSKRMTEGERALAKMRPAGTA
jgi:hypothetical protein